MKVLLTGGAGFIGSCYLWKLNTLGIDDVIVVDAHKEHADLPALQKKKFKDYLTREQALEALKTGKLNDTNLVIHLGACTDTTERNQTYLRQNNLEYSQTLAKWALGNNIRFHYASSAAIYGDGKQGYSDDEAHFSRYKALNLYGESKRLFDQWLMEEDLTKHVAGFRFFNVFGPNEYNKGDMKSMVAKAYSQIQDTGRVKLFASSRDGFADGSEERDFVYVKDVCAVMTYFLENPNRHGIFNLGTGKARTFKDLALGVFSALGKPPQIDFIPMPDKLKGQYQYFTQADLKNLRTAGVKAPFSTLEESVGDYVKNHLTQPNPYL